MLTEMLISGMIVSILGVIAFVVVRNVIDSQDSSNWSTLDVTVITLVPSAIALVTLLGVFLGLTQLRG